MKTLAAIIIASAFAGSTALAAMGITPADRHFIRSAMEGGVSEIALAQQVLRQTSDPTARAFAHRMIRDHSQNDRQLEQVAQSLGMNPPQHPDSDAQQEMQQLAGMRPEAAAREYLRYEVSDHHKDIADFTQELSTTSNDQIRSYVQASLPVLHAHLRLAERDASNDSGAR